MYGIRAVNEMGGLGEMVTIEGTGVESITADGEIVGVRYYNLQGIETRPGNEPTSLVKVITYSNGTTKAVKVME